MKGTNAVQITATYSPDDNRLRLSASTRLPRELYERVKAAGFAWAPKQDQFIAPMWTPERADLCIELAGEIEDDDGSLIERAEERSERFEGYQERRAEDAQRAHDYVQRIAEGIPLGQPILVGHHSQRHAERDAKRIENGMRKAVRAFETSEYWKRRAAAAISHAKYKERPDVRHRRIKGLEADQRKHQRSADEAAACARIWDKVPRVEWDKQTAFATYIAGRTSGGVTYGLYSALADGRMHGDTAWRQAIASCARSMGYHARWLEHIANRLEYERAMLADAGGTEAQRVEASGQEFEVGGRVKVRGEWVTVRKVNKRGGVLTSLTTDRRFVATITPEEVQAYEAPAPEVAEAAKAAAKVPPILNYRGEGFHVMTRDEWTRINADYKGTRELGEGATMRYGREPDELLKASQAAGQVRHRIRTAYVRGALAPVFISDEKEKAPPKVGEEKPARRSFKPKAKDEAPAEAPATHSPVHQIEGEPNEHPCTRCGAYAMGPGMLCPSCQRDDEEAAGDPPATQSQAEPAGAKQAAAVGADPAQVAAIIDTCMRRRREWADEGREPYARDIQREADTLLAIAEQPDVSADLGNAYRAASLHLVDVADEARAREARRAAACDLGRAARAGGQMYALNPYACTADAHDEAAGWREGFEAAPPATHSQTDEREHCPHCDAAHVPGATQCQACGRSMDGAETFKPAPPATHSEGYPPATHSQNRLEASDPGESTQPLEAPADPPVFEEAKPARPALDRDAFMAMRETLRTGGVQSVSAPELFPTPPDLAARIVREAQLFDGARVLEPSAGTGRLIEAWLACDRTGSLVAVELVPALADRLHDRYTFERCGAGRHVETVCADFVGRDLAIGTFDAVIMNPPFSDFADMAHVRRAFSYLGDGGRLVAVMSSGVTFRSDRRTVEFRRWVDELGGVIEALPANTFASSGTGVNTVLLTLTRPESGPHSLGAQRRAKVAA